MERHPLLFLATLAAVVILNGFALAEIYLLRGDIRRMITMVCAIGNHVESERADRDANLRRP